MIRINTTSREKDYSDLDLDFIPKLGTKEVNKLIGVEAIKRSVRNLILTNFYERPFRHYLGSNAQTILFDPITTMTAHMLNTAVIETIKNFEPRVRLISVATTPKYDENGYDCQITFQPLNRLEPVVTSLFLERIR